MIIENEMAIDLIKSLFEVDEMHEEYENNNIKFCIDLKKDGENKLILTISYDEEDNSEKEQFEEYVSSLDDDIFVKAIEEIKKDIPNFDEIYQSKSWKNVANAFQDKVNEIINLKINKLTHLIR